MRSTLVIAACLACLGVTAKAHEFWIAPLKYQIAPGDNVVASLRVGTEFVGANQSYIPRNFKRFQYVQNGKAATVPGVVGDRPAANFPSEDDGLMVLVHQTTNLSVTWDTWEKFEDFVRHKDAEWVLDDHLAKGLSKEGVREVYSRYAKSLIAVGAGKGKDVVSGMLTEIIALENPYTDNMADGFTVGVLYNGKPRKSTQVEVFERDANGAIRIFTLKTNGKGTVNVPVVAGRQYMLDSVVLRRPLSQPSAGKPYAWESLWANLTFEVPG